jgi:hypothetical protein
MLPPTASRAHTSAAAHANCEDVPAVSGEALPCDGEDEAADRGVRYGAASVGGE